MSKEELKQEAEVYSYKLYHSKAWNPGEDMLVKAYLAGAEPREKQIQIDAEQIRALQKQNGELTDRVQELEAQIEKMKCCYNCKHFDFNELNYCHKGVYRERQYVCSKWEFGN
jgi:hypothetical protein